MNSASFEDRGSGLTNLAVSSVEQRNAVHKQLQRILADATFHNSKRYSDLLTYIVDRTLSGQHDSLKERLIGIEVFGRHSDYDTSGDAIVRVAAAEVRKRLTRYYTESRHHHELRIELPMRSYVAEFNPAVPARESPIPGPPPASQRQGGPLDTGRPHESASPREARATGAHILGRLAYILLIAVLTVGLMVVFSGVKRMAASTHAVNKFWAPMLTSTQPVLISIGTPAQEKPRLLPQGVSPAATEAGLPLNEFIAQQVNFPVSDLTAASGITSFLARSGRESVIRLADSTTLSDLHGSPLIVLGSFPNEWAVRLGANLPFKFQSDEPVHWIEDTTKPTDRRWAVNLHAPYDQVTSEYALLTRGLDPTTGQWWIGIGGLTVLGTIATQEMLTDAKAMEAFSAQLPSGWERKNMEVVLEITLIKGSAGASRVVASRSW